MTERAYVTYTGDQAIYLPGFISPLPDRVEPGELDKATGERGDGTVVQVDATAADGLVARGDFAAGGTPPDQDPVPEPVPEGRRLQEEREKAAAELAEQQEAASAELERLPEDPQELRGDALDDALRTAGLTTTGTAQEKRDRLEDHHDALAAQARATTPRES